MAVKAFKMVGGDEIVAELLDTKSLLTNTDTVTHYVLRRPHILQLQQLPSGGLGLALVPWTLSNPSIERMEVPASAVLLQFDPSDSTEKQYLEQTSGITLTRPGQRLST